MLRVALIAAAVCQYQQPQTFGELADLLFDGFAQRSSVAAHGEEQAALLRTGETKRFTLATVPGRINAAMALCDSNECFTMDMTVSSIHGPIPATPTSAPNVWFDPGKARTVTVDIRMGDCDKPRCGVLLRGFHDPNPN